MNDQISRQKLIEKISKLPILITEDDDFVDLDAVLYAINSQPPADQWIPCSSGTLPKHCQQVFITTELFPNVRFTSKATYYTQMGAVDHYEWDGEGFYNHDSEYGYSRREDVVAWMPAEPYKGLEYK